jgi:HAD superfamily hydrolase (TIGR01549 family)
VSKSPFSARYVLFDWDGTLLNSYTADSRAYLAMFRSMGIRWGMEDLERCYSPDWYQVYRAARIPRRQWLRADQLWRAAYAKQRPSLLPGTRALLRTLERKFVLGIVTGGSRGRVRRQIREFDFAKYFSACIYSEDAARKKPHPAPLHLALSRLRAVPEECVYVGDSPQDVEMARRARVRSIGVLGPFPTEAGMRAAQPDLLLRSIRSLPQHLRPSGEPAGAPI